MMTRIVIVVVAALAVGCAAKAWYRPGLTQAEWQADRLFCQTRANQFAGAEVASMIMSAQEFHSCMVENGYSLVEKK